MSVAKKYISVHCTMVLERGEAVSYMSWPPLQPRKTQYPL